MSNSALDKNASLPIIPIQRAAVYYNGYGDFAFIERRKYRRLIPHNNLESIEGEVEESDEATSNSQSTASINFDK